MVCKINCTTPGHPLLHCTCNRLREEKINQNTHTHAQGNATFHLHAQHATETNDQRADDDYDDDRSMLSPDAFDCDVISAAGAPFRAARHFLPNGGSSSFHN
ncbi:hypothetical protein ZHAS_00014458 [Anopheles sinensis]|uniref:Uncharacterized protein n=1 Tax=Anopheles sinensis TaxID=74873 RepID=A0A084W8C9_ANOSI|nr:hypothetical protein ZHAS_00014458 [Anopheles sinensis]